MRARLRGDGIALCDDEAGDAPLAGATGLTTAHVNRCEAHVGTIIVHRTLFAAARGVMRWSTYQISVHTFQHSWTIEAPYRAAAVPAEDR